MTQTQEKRRKQRFDNFGSAVDRRIRQRRISDEVHDNYWFYGSVHVQAMAPAKSIRWCRV